MNFMEDNKKMKEKLEQLLRQKNMSFYKLSKLSGVSESTFSSLRNGVTNTLSFENLEKVADVLEISLDIFRTNNTK